MDVIARLNRVHGDRKQLARAVSKCLQHFRTCPHTHQPVNLSNWLRGTVWSLVNDTSPHQRDWYRIYVTSRGKFIVVKGSSRWGWSAATTHSVKKLPACYVADVTTALLHPHSR